MSRKAASRTSRILLTRLLVAVLVAVGLLSLPRGCGFLRSSPDLAYADSHCGFALVGDGSHPPSLVQDIATFDDGTGPALYTASLGGVHKWDGTHWERLPPVFQNVGFRANALKVFNDGTGLALYVGGSMHFAERNHGIAKWDGRRWLPVGEGFYETYSQVHALEVFDDGRGPALYAGGSFIHLGLPSFSIVNGLAKWTGRAWEPVGTGGENVGVIDDSPSVRALATFDDGTGPALFVGGRFLHANGFAANHIAKWDGRNWSALGNGVVSAIVSVYNGVHDLAVFNDGTGPALYVAGYFHCAGGPAGASCSNDAPHAVLHLAKWDGTTWAPLAHPITRGAGLWALAVFDDGTGPALYIGGEDRLTMGDLVPGMIARWSGRQWSPLGRGMQGGEIGPGVAPGVFGLASLDDGTGQALYVGGNFTEADGLPVQDLAKWGCGTSAAFLRGDANGDGEFDVSDAVRILLGKFTAAGLTCGDPEDPDRTDDACDANDDGAIDVSDPLYLLQHLFRGGPPPPAPFPEPGPDPTPDGLPN